MSVYTDIAQHIIDLISEEWRRQGHDLTGAFTKGLTYKVDENQNEININIYDNTERGYGVILNKGVPAANIPYSPGSGARSSRYIAGLANYAKLRMGADDKTALSIAFAIAAKHKREGMPLPGTVRYSSTGKRTQFVEDATADIRGYVEKKLGELIKEAIEI